MKTIIKNYIIASNHHKGVKIFKELSEKLHPAHLRIFNDHYAELVIDSEYSILLTIELIIINKIEDLYGRSFSDFLYIDTHLKEDIKKEITLRSNNIKSIDFF